MKKVFLLLFLAATIFSCKVTWVPTKSVTALSMIQKIQDDANNAFYTNPYNESAYSSVSDEIDSLISFDKARIKSGNILTQDNSIKTLFGEFKNEHSSKVNIAKSEQDTYKAYFNSVISPRLISENSLK